LLSSKVNSFNNAPVTYTPDQKKKLQQNKLALSAKIHAALSRAYNEDNPKITHFYNNIGYSGVPLWAFFEIINMGELGFLLSCLHLDVRKEISLTIGLGTPIDTDYHLVYKYVYLLKDLRNSVAHNAVVFDARFRKFDPSRSMKQFLKNEIGLPFVNFKSIGDYFILICFFLKALGVSKTEIKAFIREYERITKEYIASVDIAVSSIVVRSDLGTRLETLKRYI